MLDLSTFTPKELDIFFMNKAYQLAQKAANEEEVPVGALITLNNKVISSAYNKKESQPSATFHAEILAINEASIKLNRWRLSDCTLYVTLEPCLMCTGALISSRIGRLVYGTNDPKAGAIQSVFQLSNHSALNHKINYTVGVMQSECSTVLKEFFQNKRRSRL